MLPTRILQDAGTFQKSIISWYGSNGRTFPWRQTQDPFKVLIAEVILKLTGAWKAQQAYECLVAKYGTPERMANASLPELTEAFRPLGLHKRAKLLIDIANELNLRFRGSVPKSYDELVSVRGIGQYTANAILCLAYGEHVPLVDGSVSRVFRRCFGYPTNKEAYADKELWLLAFELLPNKGYREYNLGLLDIGALVCKHVKPRCSECPISAICIDWNSEAKGNSLEAKVDIAW